MLLRESIQEDAETPETIDAGTELPNYFDLPGGAPRTHQYNLEDSKGKPWVVLRLGSRAPSSKALPVFFEGDKVNGEVEANLGKGENCKAVIVKISGDVTSVGQEPMVFWRDTKTLWSSQGQSSKADGVNKWAFVFSFPKEAEINSTSKDYKTKHLLPPTFSERASPAYIDYKLSVTIKRSFLRVNQTLGTSIVYVPRRIAPSPSLLRITAYRDGSELLGPEIDLEGWSILQSVELSGTLFGTKAVKVQVMLSVAAPLVYASGSPIPLVLSLTSLDSQALDIIAQPSAVRVFLTRIMTIGSAATDDSAPKRSNNTFTEQLNQAFWWLAEEDKSRPGVRVLHGEIDVRKNLTPSFVFSRLTVNYHIAMLPLSAVGFSPSTPVDQQLISQKVDIVAENASGVVPCSHAPPGYVRPDQGNYNNSMGYLENGNQRFYHHNR